jgi:hypothetical protein
MICSPAAMRATPYENTLSWPAGSTSAFRVVWARALESYNVVFVKSLMVARGCLEAPSRSVQIQRS